MKTGSTTAAVLLGLGLLGPLLFGGDICIPDRITVGAVEGSVYFEVGGNRLALSDVTVEVAPYGYKKPPLAAVVTKQDGRFSLARIRPGRYYLSVRHATIIGLSVEMRVTGPKRTKGGAGEIEVVLRNDPSKYCAGGTVTVVRRTGSRSGPVRRTHSSWQRREGPSDLGTTWSPSDMIQSATGFTGKERDAETGLDLLRRSVHVECSRTVHQPRSFQPCSWLTERGIHQRSMFGQTRFVPYAQVQELVIERDEALVVKYQGKSRLASGPHAGSAR
jgi:hypothetical protein